MKSITEYVNKVVRSHISLGSKILCVGGPSGHLRRVELKNVNAVSLNLSDRDYKKFIKSIDDPLVIGDVTEAPFADNTFDVIFSSNVFEHIKEPWIAAKECIRVVKPKGLIFVFGPFSHHVHGKPDYWRFSDAGLTYLFERTERVKTVESKMMKFKLKRKGWSDYWTSLYYGIKK